VTAVPAERILQAIHVFRGERVLLDTDLAILYGVETRVLIQAVKRNLARFPGDFMFQLTESEWANLKSQSVISSAWGGRRSAPYAFTELGVAMLSSVLNGERFVFDFDASPRKLEAWLGQHFRKRISVRRECDGGFPDDASAAGPTIVSTATLALVATWFPELDTDSVRSRLRTNIEVDGVPAFWEDRLFAAAGTTVPFAVGETPLEGTNPCQRCVVPSRDPETGSSIAGFAQRVAERRAATLPWWADRRRFDHFYRLAVNTRPAPAQAGRAIRVGDAVTIIANDRAAAERHEH